MLVITRKIGEKVYIGKDIVLDILEMDGRRVRIGITAPQQVQILRAELEDYPSANHRKTDQPHTGKNR